MEPVLVLRLAKTIIGLFGIVGNSLICLVIYRVRALQNLTNALICHQAVIDLISCLFMLLHSNIPNPDKIPSGLSGRLFCQLWDAPVAYFTLMVASTLNLMIVTLERYFAIIFPFKYLSLFNRNFNIMLVCGVWVLTLTYKLNDMSRYGLENGTCITRDVEWKRGLGIVQFLVEYFIPLIVMMFAYAQIMITLKRSEIRVAPSGPRNNLVERQIQSSENPRVAQLEEIMETLDSSLRRARRNTFKTLVLVYIAFLICWTPNSFIFLFWNLGYHVDNSNVFYRITVIMAVSNSAINFVIYGFKYRQFRKGLKLMLKCDHRRMANASTAITDVAD